MSDIETILPGDLIMDEANAYWRVKFVNDRLSPSEPHILAEMCQPEDLGALSVTAVFTFEALKKFRVVQTP